MGGLTISPDPINDPIKEALSFLKERGCCRYID